MSDNLIGKKLGDYVIQELLGRGGMAHVYRGLDNNLQRFAAVKVIDSRLLTKGHEEEYRARFRREARAIAKLTQPNIVGVYQFGEFGPLYYMAMEFIEGQDLHFILKMKASTNERVSKTQIVRVIHDIGAALDYAHSSGVIHRDVKPSNIMIRPDDRAILTDFGLALDVPEGTGGNTFGSAHYIAPEQAISSRNAVPQSDLYSLGVVLYQMMTGKVPFDDSSAMSVALKHLSDAPPPPRQVDPTITPAVEKVILKALEKEPSKRYKSGAAFSEALQDAMGFTETLGGTRPSRLFPPIGAPDGGTGTKRSTREIQALNLAALSTAEADSDVSQARRTIQFAQDLQARDRRRPLRLALAGIAAIVASIAVVATVLTVTAPAITPPAITPPPAQIAALSSPGTEAIFSLSGTEAMTPDTDTAGTMLALSASPIAPTDVPTDAPTDAPTDVPTDAPTPDTNAVETMPALSASPLPPTPIETAIATRERRPTVTPTPPVVAVPTDPAPTDAAPTTIASSTTDATASTVPGLTLRYDENTFVMLNASGAPVSVRNLTFERRNSAGGLVRYQATTWETVYLDRLPAGDCLMLWRIGIREVPAPDYCGINRAWFAVGQPRFFWVSVSNPNATFDVLRDLSILATCPVNAGECLVPLEG
ncbi:MAG: protein kinase [Chloroflexota bacterium]|nr:protein kinase [Chloroflexota bacterium]